MALEYGIISQPFFDSLPPEQRALGDLHILNELIESEIKAHKKAAEDREHPGMERFETLDDFWAEVDDANEV